MSEHVIMGGSLESKMLEGFEKEYAEHKKIAGTSGDYAKVRAAKSRMETIEKSVRQLRKMMKEPVGTPREFGGYSEEELVRFEEASTHGKYTTKR